MGNVSLHIDNVDIVLKGEAKVATGDHNAIRLVDDLINIGETLQALDLRVDR